MPEIDNKANMKPRDLQVVKHLISSDNASCFNPCPSVFIRGYSPVNSYRVVYPFTHKRTTDAHGPGFARNPNGRESVRGKSICSGRVRSHRGTPRVEPAKSA